jgi:hypothetical protein
MNGHSPNLNLAPNLIHNRNLHLTPALLHENSGVAFFPPSRFDEVPWHARQSSGGWPNQVIDEPEIAESDKLFNRATNAKN